MGHGLDSLKTELTRSTERLLRVPSQTSVTDTGLIFMSVARVLWRPCEGFHGWLRQPVTNHLTKSRPVVILLHLQTYGASATSTLCRAKRASRRRQCAEVESSYRYAGDDARWIVHRRRGQVEDTRTICSEDIVRDGAGRRRSGSLDDMTAEKRDEQGGRRVGIGRGRAAVSECPTSWRAELRDELVGRIYRYDPHRHRPSRAPPRRAPTGWRGLFLGRCCHLNLPGLGRLPQLPRPPSGHHARLRIRCSVLAPCFIPRFYPLGTFLLHLDGCTYAWWSSPPALTAHRCCYHEHILGRCRSSERHAVGTSTLLAQLRSSREPAARGLGSARSLFTPGTSPELATRPRSAEPPKVESSEADAPDLRTGRVFLSERHNGSCRTSVL